MVENFQTEVTKVHQDILLHFQLTILARFFKVGAFTPLISWNQHDNFLSYCISGIMVWLFEDISPFYDASQREFKDFLVKLLSCHSQTIEDYC